MNEIGSRFDKLKVAPRVGAQPDAAHQDRWLLLICLLAFGLYLAPYLATMTMGLDGVVYASIAKLIATTRTEFWYPPWHTMPEVPFDEHPPLGLWLQGQWFKVFGQAFWVEKAFLSVIMLINAALVVRLWRDLAGRADGWRPLLILLLLPVTNFTIKSNALENLVCMTALAATICAWHGRRVLALNLLAGLLCGVGFLIKGPVALFPLIAPFVFAAVIDRNYIRGATATLVCAGGLTAFVGVVLTNPVAYERLVHYLNYQVVASLLGNWPIVNHRGYMLYHLAISLCVCALCGAIAWLTSRTWTVDRRFWAALIIGCCASLPLLLSPRQFKHYLFPSLPYFAIAAALLSEFKLPRLSRRILIIATAALLTIAVARFVLNFAAPGKDQQVLAEATRIAAAAQGDTVQLCRARPVLQAYLARHHDLRSAVAARDSAAAAGCIKTGNNK